MKNVSEENVKKDKEILFSIVKEMSSSMTGALSTKHWAKDALWFDIPPFASKGIPAAVAMFDRVFSSFKSYRVEFLETDIRLNGNMGIVCTVQKVNIVLKSGDTKLAIVRQTDCFEKQDDEWKLIHEHVSFPSGGNWDGKIITE